MLIPKLFRGTRAASMFWLAVSLGSCAYVGSVNNQYTSITYTATELPSLTLNDPHCSVFERSPRLGHVRPTPPKVDLQHTSSEQAASIILSYAEDLKKYLDDEERFIREDILRHNQKCRPEVSDVFQKGSGI